MIQTQWPGNGAACGHRCDQHAEFGSEFVGCKNCACALNAFWSSLPANERLLNAVKSLAEERKLARAEFNARVGKE